MLGLFLGALSLIGVEAIGITILNPINEASFSAGFWTGFIGAIVCLIINTIFDKE